MSIIEATSVGVKTMADDTLRLTVDIDPRYAQEAFKLFGMRGASIALARLTPEAAQSSARQVTKEKQESEKGGELAKLAGIWCADPTFWKWITQDSGNPVITCESIAADCVRVICMINSRAELDHNAEAAQRFHKLIREPYSEWLKGR